MGRKPKRQNSSTALSQDDVANLPLIALIGRPNVGKSSLFNRLVGGRPALVQDEPGVTRDRRYGIVKWQRAQMRVVDTGGLDPSAEGILGAMRGQTLRAVDEADVIVFVVDAHSGITALDAEVGRALRRTGKPIIVAANKVDHEKRDLLATEAHSLGFTNLFAVSAAHGRGVGSMMDAVLRQMGTKVTFEPKPKAPARRRSRRGDQPDEELDASSQELVEMLGITPPPLPPPPPGPDDEEILVPDFEEPAAPVEVAKKKEEDLDRPIRLALVGKPNVGKSSLVNRMLGQERVLVHDKPGTTRDPIDSPFSYNGREFVLVDTAGLRRRKVVKTLTEAVSAKMSRDQIERADVVALVLDLEDGASDDDAKLASFVEQSGRALVIVLNKSDIVGRSQLDGKIQQCKERLNFVEWATVIVTSAMTGRAVDKILEAARAAYVEWSRRVPTAELNRNFEEMITRRPPPSGPSGRHIRLYYATQAAVSPPLFFVSANIEKAVSQPYRRYLANQFRKYYGFAGSPLKVIVRGRTKEEEVEESKAKRTPGQKSQPKRPSTPKPKKGAPKRLAVKKAPRRKLTVSRS